MQVPWEKINKDTQTPQRSHLIKFRIESQGVSYVFPFEWCSSYGLWALSQGSDPTVGTGSHTGTTIGACPSSAAEMEQTVSTHQKPTDGRGKHETVASKHSICFQRTFSPHQTPPPPECTILDLKAEELTVKSVRPLYRWPQQNAKS